MSDAIQFIQMTTRDLTPEHMRMPAAAWTVFTALNKVHGIWRWYRRVELYRNPDNFFQLIAGHAVNFAVGDKILIRIAAQCVLIATRILECVEQQAALYRAGGKWLNDLQGFYPQPIRSPWIKKQSSKWISPSTSSWWSCQTDTLFSRIERIVRSTFHLCKRIWKLSMQIMDVMDAFYLSPATSNQSINEFFVHAIKWTETLVEKKEILLQGIVSNREIIEKILRGSPFTYEQLEKAVTKALDRTEMLYHQARGVTNFGNGVLMDFGKRALNSGMVVTGFASYRPLFLVPCIKKAAPK
jgi:hypothetical protein